AVMRQYFNKHVPKVSQEEFNKEWLGLMEALKKDGKTLDVFLKETNQTQDVLVRDMVAKLQWKEILKRVYPDDKLKGYYDANKPHFDQVRARASHIRRKLPPNAWEAQRNQTRQQLLALRQEIMTGKMTFEDAAKKFSECPSRDPN